MGKPTKGELLQGTLDMLILSRLARGAMHGFGIAVNKVEDAVGGGIEAGDKRRPRHGALRRSCGFQPAEAAGVAEPRDIWQVFPMPLHEFRVHAVDAQNDHFFPVRIRSMAGTRAEEGD